MEGLPDDVVVLRSGQVEWRINDLTLRMDTAQALALAQRALVRLGWTHVNQLGLRTEGLVTVMPDERRLRDQQERLRAQGRFAGTETVHRPLMLGPWGQEETHQHSVRPARRTTEHVAHKGGGRKTATRQEIRTENDPSIDVQLFEDPIEQLQYEVRHAYLMGVPLSQRTEWPMMEYTVLPSFLRDLEEQNGAISRAQIVAAIVDVVSSRMNDVNSRRPRILRDGGGDDGRPIIVREDGAVAWRANISAGTPAARRIMWWRNPSGVLELTRLATHDDLDMPER